MIGVPAFAADLATTLERRPRAKVSIPEYREAAVLIPLVMDDERGTLDDARVVFTVRRADLRTHAGQISFPGGGRDPDDADLVATALREAEEEIGVPASRVVPLGLLDDVPTVPSRYVITPVVGLVRGPIELVPRAAEVAATFDCSLRELANPAIYSEGTPVLYLGRERTMHEYRIAEHRVWGATARVAWQLLDALAASRA